MFLKIAVLNNSGNVGKSMLSQNLFSTKLPGAEIIKVESNNSDGTNDEKISAKQIDLIFKKLDDTDVCILDVGSSNIETLLNYFEKLEGSIEDIDFFFIPTVPKQKQQVDTVSTVLKLFHLGVKPDQIKLIFNFYDSDYSLEKLYPIVFDDPSLKDLKLNKFENQFLVNETELFDHLSNTGYTYSEIIHDSRDFKSLIRAAKTKEEREELSMIRLTHRFAVAFEKGLESTFEKINKTCNLIGE
jgi:hypothetical protein